MNTRIKELWTVAALAGPDPSKWDSDPQEQAIEYFAELIIQECIYAIESTNDRYRRDYFADKVRSHFGVE